MKHLTNAVLFTRLIVLTSLLLTTSCEGDKCAKVECGTNGVCMEGNCLCNDGYEGESCKDEVRAKFIDYWHAEDYGCNGLNGAILNFRIEPGTSINDVNIYFQSGSEVLVYGTCVGNIIYIPFQNYSTTTIVGSMTLLDTDILFQEVTINNQITILDCSCHAMRI
ncbi:MAG: hypothetical protein K9I85_12910 [Saprospiraceae bacterium]|nr:hypothetical protein [Saprospiraceae bacterium]